MRVLPALAEEAESPEQRPYLRRSKPVEVRRRRRWKRLAAALLILAGLGLFLLAAVAYAVYLYLLSSPRFALRQPAAIGETRYLAREEAARIFASDLGRSVFATPLEERRRQLMALPWVEAGGVLRGWPNRLRVWIREREPVAFVRPSGPRGPGGLCLMDRQGVLLPIPRRARFRFPVLHGISDSDTAAERERRAAVLMAVLRDLDREKPARAGDLSEVDLSDPNDAVVTVSAAGDPVVVHLGNTHFLERYKLFLENIEGWRQQYGSVRSVDLRFEKQVIVKPRW